MLKDIAEPPVTASGPEIPGEPPSATKRRRGQRSLSASSPPHRPTPGPRPSQRAPKSCVECTRRKIRCDKELPCGACKERGAAGDCRREAVFVKGAIVGGDVSNTATTLESLAKEVQELRQRVGHLEAGAAVVAARAVSPDIDCPVEASSPIPITDVEQSKLPGTMEEMALGIGESIRWKGLSLLDSRHGESNDAMPWYQSISFQNSLSALPSKSYSHLLVTFYLDEVSWMACAVHGRTFLIDHEAFWVRLERGELQDDLWLGLLFAVLSVAALFMDENQATTRGLSFHYLRIVGTAWFDNAIAVLFRLGICRGPSLLTCQILQVLGPAFHLTGNTSLHQSLAGIGVTQARGINLHLLGSREDESWQESMAQELGRRIWWNNVETDWTFLPYNRYAQFIPHQFKTQKPQMTDRSSPMSDGPLTIHYRTACYKSARCIYDVYGHLGLGVDPTYERVTAASRALDDIVANLPVELQFGSEPQVPFGLSTIELTRQRLLAMTLAYRSYQVHRLYFVRSLTDTRFSLTRIACLRAADIIVSVADRGLPHVYFQLWNVTVSMVAAGIIMALRLLETARSGQASSEAQRLKVQSLVDRLGMSNDHSGIASRGATFINHLLRVEEEISAGIRTEVKFTRESMLSLVQSGMPVTQPCASPRPDGPPLSASFAQSSEPNLAPFVLGQDDMYGIGTFDHGEIDFAALLNDFVGET